MKSLLEKLGKEKSKNEKVVVGTNSGKTREENSQAEIISGGPPVPCPACGSVLAWFDIYGGGPHCGRCRPWPAESFVRSVMGYDARDACWRVLWPIEASGPLGMPETPCTHRMGRNRAVWPVADRDGLLVADLERVAEVENFVECLGCGIWFSDFEFQNLQKGL